MFIKAIYAISLSDMDSNTPPSHSGLDIWSMKLAGLDICGWPNNNHMIGSDTILELSGLNSTPKVSSWGRVVQVFIKAIYVISLSDVGL